MFNSSELHIEFPDAQARELFKGTCDLESSIGFIMDRAHRKLGCIWTPIREPKQTDPRMVNRIRFECITYTGDVFEIESRYVVD